MGANRADVIHLPRTCLIAIRSAGQRADRANVDAGSAFVAIKMVGIVWNDLRMHAAIPNAERIDTQAFVADPNAAIAQDAAGRVVVNHRRPLLLILMNLDLDKAAFRGAIAEGHVLQFAFAAFIANRTVERVVRKQKFEHALASALYLLRIR